MLVQQLRRLVPDQLKQIRLGRVAWIVATFVTLLVCWLHVLFLRSAGGLWRDEVVTFNVATQPSVAKLWESLRFESFPGLFHLLLRCWVFVVPGGTDSSLRFLGCFVGLAVLAALWINGRFLRYKIPVLSLSLVALSALTIRTTDELRAYGLGTLFIILTLGLVWRVLEFPSLSRAFLAAIAAILSVQSLYQNSFLLLGICIGAATVTLRGRRWRDFTVVVGIGLAALTSLAIYIPPILRIREVSDVVARGVQVRHLLAIFRLSLCDGGPLMFWIWTALVVGGCFLAFRRAIEVAEITDRDLALFSGATMIAAGLGFFLWLKALGLPSQPWYFVPLLAVVSVSLDAILGTLPVSRWWEAMRLVVLAGLSGPLFFHAIPGIKMRQTNIDVVASQLEKVARKDDLIIVYRWFLGTTFSRYFHGQTEWLTLPPLRDQTLQRLDLFKEQMVSGCPIESVTEKIENTFRKGHKVWLVGALPFHKPGEEPPELAAVAAGQPPLDHDRYGDAWAAQVAHFVQIHGKQIAKVPVPIDQEISPYENPALLVVAGWRLRVPAVRLELLDEGQPPVR